MARKRALLIGIDRYPALPARFQLAGCVNDVRLLGQLLRDQLGFAAADVTVLTDEAATRADILAALDALIAQSAADDVIVFHYSGHGSNQPDTSADEPDATDEVIVPSDCAVISDDELQERVSRLAALTPCLTVIVDSCHSGSITRDAFGGRDRWLPSALLPRPGNSPSAARALRAATRGERGPSGWLTASDTYVLIAACRDEERAKELDVRRGSDVISHGALTYLLVQELMIAPPHATYRDVFERVSVNVTARFRDQHPQLEGAADRVLFGTEQIEPLRYVQIGRREGDRVTLQAGAAHGMTIGSRWEVRPGRAAAGAEATTRLGVVEIAAVRTITADGVIVEEAAGQPIAPGTRAIEIAHAFAETRLLVEIVAPAGEPVTSAALRTAVDASPLLRQIAPGEIADVRVYLLPPRAAARPGDPAPQLTTLTAPTWAVVGRDGQLAMPACPVAEPDAIATIRGNLEKAARYRQLLAIRNPDRESRLIGQVEARLSRRTAGGRLDTLAPAAGGYTVVDEGDWCALEVTSRSRSPLYVSVVDFGLTGGISVVHPPGEETHEALLPGRRLVIPLGEAYLPADAVIDPQTGTAGPEILKLFVTTQPTSFAVLRQEGFRRRDAAPAGRPRSVLGQLLERAQRGGDRDVEPNQAAAGQDWTTLERVIYLRRRPSP